MPGPFNDQEATTGFDMSDAYRRASGNSPVKAKDLKAAYRPYNNTGKPLKVGRKKNKTDAQLYKLATTEVLEWYRSRKQAPKKKKAASAPARAVRKASSQQQSRTSTRRSGGSASTGRKLPDTATRSGARVTTASRPRLPSITPSEGKKVNRSAPSTHSTGVRIQRPAGRGFTQYGI